MCPILEENESSSLCQSELYLQADSFFKEFVRYTNI